MSAEIDEPNKVLIVQIIGVPSAGKSTVARVIEEALVAAGLSVIQEDIDELARVVSAPADFQEKRLECLRQRSTKVLIQTGCVNPNGFQYRELLRKS